MAIGTEEDARREATAKMMFAIAEGLASGTFKTFTFKVRQHQKMTQNVYTGRTKAKEKPKVEVSFSMDVDEQLFKDFVKQRAEEIDAATLVGEQGGRLSIIDSTHVSDPSDHRFQVCDDLSNPTCGKCGGTRAEHTGP